MIYQATLSIGGAAPQQIRSGWWECSWKAFDELAGMIYGKIPMGISWNIWLTIKH